MGRGRIAFIHRVIAVILTDPQLQNTCVAVEGDIAMLLNGDGVQRRIGSEGEGLSQTGIPSIPRKWTFGIFSGRAG